MAGMVVDTKRRFSEAVWFEWMQKRDIIILGAGGIGSWVTIALARAGCNVHVYDMDTVELVNVAGQLYGTGHAGMPKVEALGKVIEVLSDTFIIPYNEKYTEDSIINKVTIAAFDNMASRKLAFEMWDAAYGEDEEAIFIDGRLLAEEFQIYAVTKGHADRYRATLFSDGEVAEAPCSLKSTSHCSMGIASNIVAVLTNFAANVLTKKEFGMEMREVPFSIISSIPLFTFEIQQNAQWESNKEEKGGSTTSERTTETGDKGPDNRGVFSIQPEYSTTA